MAWTRRDFLKTSAMVGVSASGAAAPFGVAAQASETPKAGGAAVVAMNAATETIDPHFSRSQAARNVLMHMYETLVTIGENGAPKLQLAENLEVSKDYQTYTFSLRKGVPFHNGKEMTSEDVKRSLERYARVSPEKIRLEPVDRITTPDASTVVVQLKRPVPSWIELIKSPASPLTIIPSEECDKGANDIASIATGPFEFVEWDGVTQLGMRKFADYKPNDAFDGRDGYGGKRTAWLDEVTFKVVTEASSRVSGVQVGEFTLADDIPIPAAKRLERDGAFKTYDRLPISINLVPMNVARAPTDKRLVRSAIQHVLNTEEIMGIATDGLFQLNPSFVYPDSPFYPEKADELVYNRADPEHAKALLEEAGYAGEEVVLLTSSDIASLKEAAVVMAEQIKSIGIPVDMKVLDWPGANAMRADPTAYNMFSTAYAIQPMLGPFQYQRLVSGPDNWFYYDDDPKMEDAWDRLLSAGNDPDRAAAWWDIEHHLNHEAYLLKLGDRGIKQASASSLQNFAPFDAMRMWDVWLS
ncbi:twin-arginine translocation signal domain-containing protein [Pikeienuella piscinae]|uniref:Twin-arginine translocation signal domain-containing protein n=1 Tax=Pikeienuella piscinae TaxID=2748098 RepID=A0A7M3T731_9RHOB|nr:ABC transporter substrate-binding protein [Pikeienuella piscinae]QIE57812.1 twin-arginine translocation signal domain-containing protein [Pikeienuella piscinae]